LVGEIAVENENFLGRHTGGIMMKAIRIIPIRVIRGETSVGLLWVGGVLILVAFLWPLAFIGFFWAIYAPK
jgi:hypothetical protein